MERNWYRRECSWQRLQYIWLVWSRQELAGPARYGRSLHGMAKAIARQIEYPSHDSTNLEKEVFGTMKYNQVYSHFTVITYGQGDYGTIELYDATLDDPGLAKSISPVVAARLVLKAVLRVLKKEARRIELVRKRDKSRYLRAGNQPLPLLARINTCRPQEPDVEWHDLGLVWRKVLGTAETSSHDGLVATIPQMMAFLHLTGSGLHTMASGPTRWFDTPLRAHNFLGLVAHVFLVVMKSIVILHGPRRGLESRPIPTVLPRYIFSQIPIKLIAIRRPRHLPDRVLRHKSLHSTHHPLHKQRHVDEVFETDSLRIVALEQVDDLGASSFDVGRLAEKADALVVVDLDSLERVGAFAVVGNLRSGIWQVEVGDCQFHQRDSPADESASRVRSSLFDRESAAPTYASLSPNVSLILPAAAP